MVDDLYEEAKDVSEIKTQFCAFDELFKEIQNHFPDLLYCDIDVHLILRYGTEHNIFPLTHCEVQ
jgi:hypothetical protein